MVLLSQGLIQALPVQTPHRFHIAQVHLESVESEPGRHGERRGVGGLGQFPVHGADLESAADDRARFAGRLRGAERRRPSQAEAGGGLFQHPSPSGDLGFHKWLDRRSVARIGTVDQLRTHLSARNGGRGSAGFPISKPADSKVGVTWNAAVHAQCWSATAKPRGRSRGARYRSTAVTSHPIIRASWPWNRARIRLGPI